MSFDSTVRSGLAGKDTIEGGVNAMTVCAEGVVIVSISSSFSGHGRSHGKQAVDELDDELRGVPTLPVGVNPRFLSNDTVRSTISGKHQGCHTRTFLFR